MSLIEKIDELERHLVKNNCYFEGAEWTFGKVREAILSQQKEHIGNTEQLTIGDKVRESNESLAEFIKQYDAQAIDDCYCRKLCEHRVDGGCELEECDRSNYNGISEYLNQPYTES